MRAGVVIAILIAGCGRIGFAPIIGDASDDAIGDDVGDGSTAACVRLNGARQHVTAISSDGSLRIWGYNNFGQIGDGTMNDHNTPTPVTLPARVVDAAGGRYETCAALENDETWCWGEGTSGQLGNGMTLSSQAHVQVSNLIGADEVAPGALHACARIGGEVWCWGDGTNGRLGRGNNMSSSVPVQVVGITTAKTLDVGGSANFVILEDDTARCWGFNSDAGCGDNTLIDRPTNVRPMVLGTVRSIVTRDGSSCAVETDGDIYCWGDNGRGQSGTGMVGGTIMVPSLVQTVNGGPLGGGNEIGQGIDFACARRGTDVWCWGGNTNGELGNGSVGGNQPYATQVMGMPPIVQIAVQAYTACALDTDGAVWCWGKGDNGELGNGSSPGTQPTPVMSFIAC